MGTTLVEIDPRSNVTIPCTLPCPVTAFSQSPSSPFALLSSFILAFSLSPAPLPFFSSTRVASALLSHNSPFHLPPPPSALPGAATEPVLQRTVEKTASLSTRSTRAVKHSGNHSFQRPGLTHRSCSFPATPNTTAAMPFSMTSSSSETTQGLFAFMTPKPNPSRAPLRVS